jgi:hypothetical protein
MGSIFRKQTVCKLADQIRNASFSKTCWRILIIFHSYTNLVNSISKVLIPVPCLILYKTIAYIYFQNSEVREHSSAIEIITQQLLPNAHISYIVLYICMLFVTCKRCQHILYFCFYTILMPITVAARSKAGTLYVCLFCVYVVEIEDFRRADPSSKESYPLCTGLKNRKSGQGPTNVCLSVDVRTCVAIPL